MSQKANSFEGGTAEADITVAGSGGASGDAIDAVTKSGATTIKYEGTSPLIGSVSMRIVYGAGAAGWVSWTFSPATTTTRTVWRWYMRFKAGDTHTNVDLCNVRRTVGHVARLWLDGSARIQVADSTSTVIATASSAVPTDTLIRIEVATTVGTTTSNGTIEAAYFLGHSTTPIETIISSSTRNLNTAAITNCRLGSASNAATARTHWFDDFAVAELASGWIGPSVASVEVASTTSAVSGVVVTVNARHPVASSTAATSTTTSPVNVVHPAASTSPAVSTVPALTLTAQHPVSSVTVAVSTSSTALSDNGISSVTGATSGTSTGIGVGRPLSATAPVVSTASGVIAKRTQATSTTAGLSTTTAPITAAYGVSTVTAAASTVVMTLGGALRDITVTARLDDRRWVSTVTVRNKAGSLAPPARTGMLTDRDKTATITRRYGGHL